MPFPLFADSIVLYEDVEALPPGSVVHMSVDMQGGNWPEVKYTVIALLKHLTLLRTDLKLTITQVEYDSPWLVEEAFKKAGLKTTEEYGYGTRWVNLGYFPGKYDVPMALLARNMWAGETDWYGTPLMELPIMEDIRTAEDVDMLIECSQDGGISLSWVRQWVAPYGISMYTCGPAGQVMSFAKYKPDQIKATLPGLKGSADYELLINSPSKATAQMDVVSVGTVYILIILVVGNIQYRKRGEFA